VSSGFRQPAFREALPPAAEVISTDPAPRLTAMYSRIWAETMRDLPFVNDALSVEAVGFRRWQPSDPTTIRKAELEDDTCPTPPAHAPAGDWIGAIITPWFINLFLLPGGGSLWSDRRPGERCSVEFPIGPLEFIADHAPGSEVQAFQYCPLFAPPSEFSSQAAARAAALAALAAMLEPLPDSPRRATASSARKTGSSRRAFFRRITHS